jgi:uncharacterized OB-fold protein
MKHPAPRSNASSAAHFAAAKEGRLLLPFCADCTRFHWPLRALCPHCGKGEPQWREAPGMGTIATYSTVVRAVNPELKDDAPYVIAFVQLDEGVRLFSNIVGVKPEEVRCGLRVQCRFEASTDPELWVPVFTPAETTSTLKRRET